MTGKDEEKKEKKGPVPKKGNCENCALGDGCDLDGCLWTEP